MAFFDSEIVQEDAKRLFGDYQQLMDRYRVFMKRFELSDDFQAKLTVEQLRTQLSQFGMTPDTMFEQMQRTLERMKGELEAQS